MTDDWEVRCDPASAGPFALLRDDPEQRSEFESFVARCTNGMVLFDIGAHYGAFTLAALNYGGEKAIVVAVDPSPTSMRIMRANLQLSKVPDRVRLIEAAIGSEDGTISMLTTGAGGGNYMVGSDSARPDATLLPQLTIATLVRKTKLVPTHVKIDVEGFEGEAIQGGADVLRAHMPMIFLELHNGMIRGRGCEPKEVLSALVACGYERFERDGTAVTIEAAIGPDIIRLVCT